MAHTLVHYIKYDEESLESKDFEEGSTKDFKEGVEGKVTWYDIRGVHDTAMIEAIGKQYEIHPLALEDIADTQQRPKFEEYDNGVFIIARALKFNAVTIEIETEQVAIFIAIILL